MWGLGLGFRVWCLGFGFRVSGLGFRKHGLAERVRRRSVWSLGVVLNRSPCLGVPRANTRKQNKGLGFRVRP